MEKSIKNVQIANPASVHCIEQGGTLRIVIDTKGQYGICTLPDGTECEEWAYFRGECNKEDNEYCTKRGTNEKLSFSEAKNIALNSDCVKEGTLKDTYMCNEYTGTWWIDLNLDKKGCMPACVINVVTKQAEINWRCTGLIPSEEIELKQVTQEESKQIAKTFVENSATYKFDGFDLEFNGTVVLRCPYCWQFVFEFQSRAAGYGDRTGKMLAQIITPHRAVVTVIEGEVTSAVLDEKWDMAKQEIIGE
jgi:hypothetical protein